jgi:RNA polymerase sigma factor (TIGR02999 family)
MSEEEPRRSGSAVSLLLQADDRVDPEQRLNALLPLVYAELQELAHRQLVRERERYSLCTTGLVHDAYLKLVGDTQVSSRGRAYFFAAAAQAMRRIIVDHARGRSRQKHGGDVAFTLLDDKEIGIDDALAQVIELDDALKRLGELSERQMHIVECRVFAGLEVEETASALDISPRTVKRDWAVARAWLLREMKGNA